MVFHSANFDIAVCFPLVRFLIWMFLPDAGLRSHLSLPSAERVDYRAACFCHRELIDVSLPLTLLNFLLQMYAFSRSAMSARCACPSSASSARCAPPATPSSRPLGRSLSWQRRGRGPPPPGRRPRLPRRRESDVICQKYMLKYDYKYILSSWEMQVNTIRWFLKNS